VPILHIQLQLHAVDASGQPAVDASGKPVTIPPPAGLQAKGPVVQVTLSIADAFAAQIVQQGGTLPTPVSGYALIDTGASTTCVDDAAAQAMGLPVINVATMTSASHASTKANIYPIRFEVQGVPITINVPSAMGAALAAQGLLMLIGRDALQHCTLHYNGIAGEFTLSI